MEYHGRLDILDFHRLHAPESSQVCRWYYIPQHGNLAYLTAEYHAHISPQHCLGLCGIQSHLLAQDLTRSVPCFTVQYPQIKLHQRNLPAHAINHEPRLQLQWAYVSKSKQALSLDMIDVRHKVQTLLRPALSFPDLSVFGLMGDQMNIPL
jgi:hypothetical protein